MANYIPDLAQIDPGKFAISICWADGSQAGFGDAETDFSIQSISKVATLCIALGRHGDSLWKRVGREPSTQGFNSVQELEQRNGHPANPFTNAGAITVTDSLLVGGTPKETLAEILQFVRYTASDDNIFIDASVAEAEKKTGHVNWALAHMLAAKGNLHHACSLTLGTYFHHCAISMSCNQLARFGRFLAGIHPKQNPVSLNQIRSVNALMMTCGQYNCSGEFAFRVGVPSKSGVGGGILAVVPGSASVAVWSPGLDPSGNSLLGSVALAELSEIFDWNVFCKEDPFKNTPMSCP